MAGSEFIIGRLCRGHLTLDHSTEFDRLPTNIVRRAPPLGSFVGMDKNRSLDLDNGPEVRFYNNMISQYLISDWQRQLRNVSVSLNDIFMRYMGD